MLEGIANRTILPPDNVQKVMYTQGNTSDIITAIIHADQYGKKDTQFFAAYLMADNLKDTLYNIWSFVRTEIEYIGDEKGHEKIKSPSKTFADRYGDCKSMSLFIASLLRNLQIPFKYRFTSYDRNEDLSHVYIVVESPEGEIIVDSVHSEFNEEEPYAYALDYYPGSKVFKDVAGIQGPPKRKIKSLISAAIIVFLIAKL